MRWPPWVCPCRSKCIQGSKQIYKYMGITTLGRDLVAPSHPLVCEALPSKDLDGAVVLWE